MAEPGGILISGTVFDQVKNKLGLSFNFLGPQRLKNIDAAVPVYSAVMSGDARPPVDIRVGQRATPPQKSQQKLIVSAIRAAAIVAFFEGTLHVVRVRATLGETLVADVGGPHVLAPIRGDVRGAHGRVVGHFLLSVQDDLGYMILAERFAGVQVFLSQDKLLLLGSSTPAPLGIPKRGEVLYDGVRYYAYSFTAEAFPKGALEVSLLIPPVRGT